jgi:hypothetical protein
MEPHQKSKDEAINIALIHHHINNSTPSGIKIRDEFIRTFPLEQIYDLTIQSGANRSTHHDLQLRFGDIIKNVEFKGSKYFKPIDYTKHPWVNGVQFYNGTGNKFKIGHKYAQNFYNTMLDKIIIDLDIQTPKPSYETWYKDVFKQGKPSTPFVIELREKGYCSQYLSDCRKQFNKNFIVSDMDLIDLMEELQKYASQVLSCKDYWLQIHGNIDNPDSFNVRWCGKINMLQINEVEQIFSKSHSDINFKFTCDDSSIFYAKLRWGYGQCITNLRLDIK